MLRRQPSCDGTVSLRFPAKTRLNDLVSTAWATLHRPACPRPPRYPACSSLKRLRAQSYKVSRTLWTASVQQTQKTVFAVKEAFLHMAAPPVLRTSTQISTSFSQEPNTPHICVTLCVVSSVLVGKGHVHVRVNVHMRTWTQCLCTEALKSKLQSTSNVKCKICS